MAALCMDRARQYVGLGALSQQLPLSLHPVVISTAEADFLQFFSQATKATVPLVLKLAQHRAATGDMDVLVLNLPEWRHLCDSHGCIANLLMSCE